jgi:hypothetical protein
MRFRGAIARMRARWLALDDKRHELERMIALYNTPDSTRAERAELDRMLDQILSGDGPHDPS